MASTKVSQNLEAALSDLIRNNSYFSNIKDFRLQHDPIRDCVQLVATTQDNRQYMHPKFLDHREINDDLSLDTLRDRLISTLEGKPWSLYSPKKMVPEFSLNELEQAQELISQCKS